MGRHQYTVNKKQKNETNILVHGIPYFTSRFDGNQRWTLFI